MSIMSSVTMSSCDRLILIQRAAGVRLTDEAGITYMDLNCLLPLGHRHPDLIKTISEQANDLCLVVPRNISHSAVVELEQLLCEAAPQGITTARLSLGSGSSAVDKAIKIARAHTRRKKLLRLPGDRPAQTEASAAVEYMDTRYMYCDDPAAEGKGVVTSKYPNLNYLARLFRSHTDAAAVIVDPVGVTSCLFEPKRILDELQTLRDLCTEHGTLLIFDETHTFGGFMGDSLFASGHYGIVPDMICIDGGVVPQGAVLCREQLRGMVIDEEGTEFDCGNQPLGCAVAAQTIKSFLAMPRESVSKNLAALEAEVGKLKEKWSKSLEIKQIGFFVTIVPRESYVENWVKRVRQLAMERGLLVGANHSRCILIKPPIVITPDDVKASFEKLTEILSTAEKELSQVGVTISELLSDDTPVTLLRRVCKKSPSIELREPIETLVTEISPTLSIKMLGSRQEEFVMESLRRFGIPTVELFGVFGYVEHLYQPGVTLDKYIIDHSVTDPGSVNGLILLHQQYIERAHDANLSIPNRWPCNAIVDGTSLHFISFGFNILDLNGDLKLLFAFEEVFAIFQCLAHVKSSELRKDLARRLCFALVERQGSLTQQVWGAISLYYSNSLHEELFQFISHADYMETIEAMTQAFSDLSK